MKKFVSAFVLLLLFCSCSENDNPIIEDPTTTGICFTESIKTSALFFDDIKTGGFNPNHPDSLHFSYDDEHRIIKNSGGLTYGSNGNFEVAWKMLDEIEDHFSYNQDTVYAIYSANRTIKPYEKKFVIRAGRLIYSKATYFDIVTPALNRTIENTYEYVDNQIFEKRNGLLYRTFTMENGNLAKVEWLTRHYATGEILYRELYTFTNYDDSSNLIKGKFFVNGCFLRAFSNNNYKRRDYTKFVVNNGVEELYDNAWNTIEFGQDANRIATIFKQICE